MSPDLSLGIILLSLAGVLMSGIPIFFGLLGMSIVFLLFFQGTSALYLSFVSMLTTVTKDIYIAVPLFVLMASLLQSSGIIGDLYSMMYKWMGGIRGGLGVGTILICTILAAMTGIGATGVISVGLMAYPEMKRRGYHKSIGLGCIPAGGALGPLIPPSVVMIIMGGFTSVSVGKLFAAGVIPGLLVSLGMIVYILVKCYVNPSLAPALSIEERINWVGKLISLRSIILPLLLIVAVLGGIYAGACTPTEAGGVGAVGAAACGLIRRRLSWDGLKEALTTTLNVTVMVMSLLIGGTIFSTLLSTTNSGPLINSIVGEMQISTIGILIIMQVIGLIMGCFMDGAAIIMITVPVFFPIVLTQGIDPLWFSFLYSMCIVIGYITPPFGMNLFYMKGIVSGEATMGEIYHAIMPYVAIWVMVFILCIAFPDLPLWLTGKVA